MPLAQMGNCNTKKDRLVKVCLDPGCGRQFIGCRTHKYCELHRKRKKKNYYLHEYAWMNQQIKHSFTRETDIVTVCDVDTCCRPFMIRLIPGQWLYPRVCPECRTPYKARSLAPAVVVPAAAVPACNVTRVEV